MKRALRFGASAGCMLGGMLGVYDDNHHEENAKESGLRSSVNGRVLIDSDVLRLVSSPSTK